MRKRFVRYSLFLVAFLLISGAVLLLVAYRPPGTPETAGPDAAPRRTTVEDLAAKGFPTMSNPRRAAYTQTAAQSIEEVVADLGNTMIMGYCQPTHGYIMGHGKLAPWRLRMCHNIKVLRLIEEGREDPDLVVPLLRDCVTTCLSSYDDCREERMTEWTRYANGERPPATTGDNDVYYNEHRRYEDPILEFTRLHETTYMALYTLANIERLGPPEALADFIEKKKPFGYRCADLDVWLIDCYFKQEGTDAGEYAGRHEALTGGAEVSGSRIAQSKWNALWDVHEPLLAARQVDVSDIQTIEILEIPWSMDLDEEVKEKIVQNFLDYCNQRRPSGEGVPRLEDAVSLWQQAARDYVEFLRKRTFEESAYRTRDWSELSNVLANEPNSDVRNPRTPMILARTRRFCKLVAAVNEARDAGEMDEVIGALERTVERLLSDRREVEETILGLVETEPEMFTGEATEKQGNRLVDLFSGFGLSGYAAPDRLIPSSLDGTQYGLMTNAILLGLTEDGRAIGPLLEIAGYDGAPFVEKLLLNCRWTRPDFSVAAPKVIIADAADRILAACATRPDIDAAAQAVVRQYAQWRSQRGLPKREVYWMYPYDAPVIPHDLPGMVTGAPPNENLFPLKLPIHPSDAPEKGLTEQDITDILDWAERFHKARTGN
ncbi:MAG: hypothetical protein ACYTAN_14375 [Planctomycetota bacterium]|jgi:hypothetical protein